MDNKVKNSSILQGKRIVLLGGTSGFGFATAAAAAGEGAQVVVLSSTQERVDKALARLPQGSEGHAADLTDEQQITALFEKIGEFDHLVFTAGEHLQFNSLSDINVDQGMQFFQLRFWGAVMAAKHSNRYIRKGGSIVLTNGTIGLRPMKGWAVAAAITGAVESLTRALAVEMAPIRVNTVCGGMVRTELWSDMPEANREKLFADVGSSLLTGKIGEAEDIAETFLYLMKANYTTGQIIVADGGGVLV